MLEPLGLTYSQYLVMLVLWERSPVKVGDLGDCLHLENGTLTPCLNAWSMEDSLLDNVTLETSDGCLLH